jgi:hypothetical protein
MIKFAKFTKAERIAVELIIDRARRVYARAGVQFDQQTLYMDLSAAHADIPLDLAKLSAFDDFNFSHHIGGIARHMDRETGKLGDCFVPRCAKPVHRKMPRGQRRRAVAALEKYDARTATIRAQKKAAR